MKSEYFEDNLIVTDTSLSQFKSSMAQCLRDMDILDKYASYKFNQHIESIGDFNNLQNGNQFKDWLLRCASISKGFEKGM